MRIVMCQLAVFVTILTYGSAHASIDRAHDSRHLEPIWLSPVEAPTSELVLGVEKVLQMRWDAVNAIAPRPTQSETDPECVTRRLLALRELNDFVRMTISGLVRAAAGTGSSEFVKEDLDHLENRWNAKIEQEFSNLLDHPLVRAERWFTISRFGAKADREGAVLASTSNMTVSLQRRVLRILESLAVEGETNSANVKLLTHQISE